MQLISDILDLREIRRTWQSSSKVIAFVPTMGNLHQGHLNLVREAKKQADIVVVSIFVNPMQFGPDEDLDAYPRTLQSDSRLLEELGVDVLFMPKATDIYARGLEQQTFVEVPGLSYMICGASRPGHFRGVATTRDDDGLAMSSRNQYLKDKERKLAPSLYEKMQQLASEIQLGRRDFSKITQEYKLQLAELGFNPDYLEIRNVENLLQPGHEDQHLVLLAAVFLGKTRLIDNLQIRL